MRDYFPMLAAADQLSLYQGYLNADERKIKNEATGRFNSSVKSFVYKLLKAEPDKDCDELVESINQEIDQFISENSGHEDFSTALIRESAVARVKKESSRPPWLRAALHWTPVAVVALILVAYLSIRFMSGIEITVPIETKAGLVQRAAAAEKVITYDEWMETRTRRGGFLKPILFWPIEPTESEIDGGSQFAGLILEGHYYLAQNRQICSPLGTAPQDQISREEEALIDDMAEAVQANTFIWKANLAGSIIPLLQAKFPCDPASR